MDVIKNHAWDLWSALAGLLAGGAGTVVTMKFIRGQNASGNGTNVNQTRANAGGDIVGRDKSNNRG